MTRRSSHDPLSGNDVFKHTTEVSPLINLLGEDRVENIKDQIAALIIDKVARDIKDWGQYLFYPPDYEYLIEDVFESLEKKIKKMYQDKALELAQIAVERFKQVSLEHLEKISEK